MRNYYRTAGPLVQTRKLEYLRIYKEVKRREAGIPPRVDTNRHSVIDEDEHLFFEAGPLVRELDRRLGELGTIARKSAVPERTIHRIRHVSEYVRIDTADRLCLAMGLPLELVYQGARTRDRWEVNID